MNRHPSDAEIEAFVMGSLDSGLLPTFEAHVASCDECSAKLATQARLELALYEVAAAMERRPATGATPRRWSLRRPVAAAAVLAAAAAIAFIAFRARRPPLLQSANAPAALANVVCPDGPDQAKCVTDAHRHGVFVQYPEWAGPPRFGGGPGSSGPSTTPFPASPIARQ